VRFYETVLAPLGIPKLMEADGSNVGHGASTSLS
jgi:hypothetical protein